MVPNGTFRKFDTTFRSDSTYEKYLMAAVPLSGNYLYKAEMEYHGKFGHTIGRIQSIAITDRIYICYTDLRLGTQTVTPNLPVFHGLQNMY